MKKIVLLLCLSTLLLTACRESTNVDRGSSSYVDTTPRSYVDTGSGSAIDNPAPTVPKEAPVLNATEKNFVPPPGNYTQNATIDIELKKSFVGKDVVKLWVWNEKGSQSIIAAEGNTITVPKMGIEVKIGPISHDGDGKTVVYINGKQSKALSNRQETTVGGTWVFISDFFLNAAQ